MASRTSATFTKRQKERARQEKQEAKQQRKLQRRLEKRESPPGSESGASGSSTEAGSHCEPLTEITAAQDATTPSEREIQ